MGFTDKLLKIMETACHIAPFLRDILKNIVQGHNGDDPTDEQWKLITPGLSALIRKIHSLGGIEIRPRTSLDSTTSAIMGEILVIKGKLEGKHGIPQMMLDLMSNKEICVHNTIQHIVNSGQFMISEKLKYEPDPFKMPSWKQSSIQIIESGINVLPQMHPLRFIARSGSIYLRDVKPFIHVFDGSGARSLFPYAEKLYDMINIGKGSLYFHPKVEFISDKDWRFMYHELLHDVTVFDLFEIEDWEFKDLNFSKRAVWEKLFMQNLNPLMWALEVSALCYTTAGAMNGQDISYLGRFSDYHVKNILSICSYTDMAKMKSKGLTKSIYVSIYQMLLNELNALKMVIKYTSVFDKVVEEYYFPKKDIKVNLPVEPSAPSIAVDLESMPKIMF